MARMSIDDMFLRDPRVLRLAKAFGWSKYEARGRLLEVFALVYDRVDSGSDDVVQVVDIDIAADCEGLATVMIEHDLAEQTRRGVRIRGAKERTNYLATRHDSGRAGGIKSGESRRNKAKQTTKVTFAENEGRVNPSAILLSPSASASADPDPKEKIPTALRASASGSNSRPVRKPKPSEPTPDEKASALLVLAKLSARNGVQYSGSAEHLRLISNQLRSGVTEADLRKVIGYAAVELEWADDPAMVGYLRPETLFGPKTIAKYLDPARTWFDRHNMRLDAAAEASP
jgi:uncharacterized phage protein (TIGR02220 family)